MPINCRLGHHVCKKRFLLIFMVFFLLTILCWIRTGQKSRVTTRLTTTRRVAAAVPLAGATRPQVFASRCQRYQAVCKNMSVPGDVKSVYVHSETGVIYCHVPKAGCTFWKRVFNFVNNKSSSIFSTSRYLVHFKNTMEEQYEPKEHSVDRYPIRMLVARDPLARILSSYLDKMYLPDFWHTWGRRFARQYQGVRSLTSTLRFLGGPHMDHRPHQLIDKILEKYTHRFQLDTNPINRTNTTTDFFKEHFAEIYEKFDSKSIPLSGSIKHPSMRIKSLQCGKYLSYEEFVSVSIALPEAHWEPTHSLCNPCQFQPTHVSLMSTFSSDAKVILAALGHPHAIDHLDYTAQVDEEIKMIVDYFFDIAYSHKGTLEFLKDCITSAELAFRLWQNFIWRGYIHPNVTYALPDRTRDPVWIKRELLAQLQVARALGVKDPSAMASAKLAFFKSAFASLSPHTLETLIRKFKYDYVLFIDP